LGTYKFFIFAHFITLKNISVAGIITSALSWLRLNTFIRSLSEKELR
jgi:hypothetical protein